MWVLIFGCNRQSWGPIATCWQSGNTNFATVFRDNLIGAGSGSRVSGAGAGKWSG